MTNHELNRKVAEAMGLEAPDYPCGPPDYWSPATNLALAMECARRFFGSKNFTLSLSSVGWWISYDVGRHQDVEYGPCLNEGELAGGLCEAIVAAHEATKEKS